MMRFFSKYTWRFQSNEKEIFLTFDDGPTPEITQFVLSELKKYRAKATFFCIGKNIKNYPEIFNEIIFTCDYIECPYINNMKKLLSSAEIKKRVLVLTESTDGAVDWVDAAELAESVGITLEQYPAWLNSMHELGAVAVSDRMAH